MKILCLLILLTTIITGVSNNDYDAAKKANNSHGTLLLTNTGKEYLNTPRGTHAEIMFINDKSINRNLIKELWIKNSPCVHCSGALLDYFKKNHHKPTIYVGRIWHFNDKNDDQGLINLIKAGFKIEVWETLHDMMYGSDTRTKDYLRKLWEKMNKKQHKEL